MAAVESAYPSAQQFRASLPVNIPMMDTPPRPSSALARGVQITEYNNSRVNPDPIILEESDLLLEEYLSPRKLRLLTGVDNLEEVHYLEMKVDTRDTSLGNFGSHVPNLTQLKLSNSIISSVRDLGSCLNNVRVLWLARSGVEDVDGISSMTGLKELYLSYNEIFDISPISMVENLQILDLEGNNIDEIAQVEFLGLCHKLNSLTLEGNPVCVTPSPDEACPDHNFREAVKRAIPHLKLLDDEPLVSVEGGIRKTASAFDDDWKLLDELLEEGIGASDDSIEAVGVGRPGTGLRPTTTTYRPGSALKPYMNATGIRPGSRAGRPPTGQRPGSARLGSADRPGSARPGSGSSRVGSGSVRPGSGSVRPGSGSRPASGERPGTAGRPDSGRSGGSNDDDNNQDTSELTQGNVVCGNPSKALRARKIPTNRTSDNARKIYAHLKYKAEHSYDTALEDDDDMREIMSELKEWKQGHKKRVEEIQASKAPQVLRIDHDHDDAISLSDDEVVTSEDEDVEEADIDNTYNKPKPPLTTPTSHGDVRPKSGVYVPKFSPDPNRPPSPSRNRRRLQHDESFDVTEDGVNVKTPEQEPQPQIPRQRSYKVKAQSTENIRSPSPFALRTESDDGRPYSGPEAPSGKFKLEPVVDKTRPKKIDRANPVIRASVYSPEKPKVEWPRATTSRAAIGQPAPQTLSRMRKGQLANVQLLPSKPSSVSK